MDKPPTSSAADLLFFIGMVASLTLILLTPEPCNCVLCRVSRNSPAPAPVCACPSCDAKEA